MSHKQIKIDDYEKIGKGSYGTVHKAEHFYHGPIAIKSLNVKDPSKDQIEAFQKEISILQMTRHDNILLFIGCVLTPYIAIVTEWCSGSSLYRHLHVDEVEFHVYQSLQLSKQTANGMQYLHSRKILHRDLKSNNIFLVGKEKKDTFDCWNVKIGDFGLATLGSNKNCSQKDKPTGSVLWMVSNKSFKLNQFLNN
jgi:B-Raf proto-oncogene serine/threonine-protein kinase